MLPKNIQKLYLLVLALRIISMVATRFSIAVFTSSRMIACIHFGNFKMRTPSLSHIRIHFLRNSASRPQSSNTLTSAIVNHSPQWTLRLLRHPNLISPQVSAFVYPGKLYHTSDNSWGYQTAFVRWHFTGSRGFSRFHR